MPTHCSNSSTTLTQPKNITFLLLLCNTDRSHVTALASTISIASIVISLAKVTGCIAATVPQVFTPVQDS